LGLEDSVPDVAFGPHPGSRCVTSIRGASPDDQPAGRLLLRHQICTPAHASDVSRFTAPILAWAAAKAAAVGVRPAGALGPVEAFGAGDLENGCATAGFHRVQTSSE
jgi:hypothetical protein